MIGQILYRGRFLYLLVSILSLLLCAPFIEEFIQLRILLDIFFTILYFSCIYAISEKKLQLVVASSLVLPQLTLTWASYFIPIPYYFVISDCLRILFFGYTTVIILIYVLRQQRISIEIICAAIVVYLLIGVTWATAYSLLELVAPGSFSTSQAIVGEGKYFFSYFSFTTLTTLGYGDITPMTSKASSLATVEAIIGQIYLTVLVARLVGLHISQREETPDKGRRPPVP